MRKFVVALLIVLCAVLGGVFYWMSRDDDKTAPVISFPDEILLYHEGEDQEVLLEGVTATDNVDGDVSDTLVVESVLPMKDGATAAVLYYAKDRSNNVAKGSRMVDYREGDGVHWMDVPETETDAQQEIETEVSVPEGSPKITLTTNKVTVKQGESYNLLSYVKDITDDKDGDDWLYRQIHIDGMGNIAGPGTYELFYTVVDREYNQSNRAKLTLVIE